MCAHAGRSLFHTPHPLHACYSAWLCATAKLNLKKRSRERAQQAGGALHARAGRIGEQVLRPAHFSNFAALAAISQHLTAQGVMSRRRRRRRGREVAIGGCTMNLSK
jgi:hypothetical protein